MKTRKDFARLLAGRLGVAALAMVLWTVPQDVRAQDEAPPEDPGAGLALVQEAREEEEPAGEEQELEEPLPPGPSLNSRPITVSPMVGSRPVQNARSATNTPSMVTPLCAMIVPYQSKHAGHEGKARMNYMRSAHLSESSYLLRNSSTPSSPNWQNRSIARSRFSGTSSPSM